MRYGAAFWVAAVFVLFGACGDDYNCLGMICDPCEPGQICCAGDCQAVYEEQGGESVLVGHYCLDTPPEACPLPQQ